MNVESDSTMAIDDSSVVYRKSGSGAAQLASSHSGPLSARERQVLILLDGRRTIEELSEFFGAEAIWGLISGLEAKGFAKRIDPDLPLEWANSVTRLQSDWLPEEPSAQESLSSMAASRWHHDWFALVNLGMLAFVIVMVTGLWAIDRHPSKVIPFGATSGQSLDVREMRGSTDEADPGGRDHAATVAQPAQPVDREKVDRAKKVDRLKSG